MISRVESVLVRLLSHDDKVDFETIRKHFGGSNAAENARLAFRELAKRLRAENEKGVSARE